MTTDAEAVAKLHVLVVEDHHDLRDLICEVLEGLGFRASAAMSADAAMVIVRAGEVAAIVTDIGLAGSRRDGVWLLDQVAAARIPLVALTGHAERADEISQLGFAAVLIKPVEMETLVDVLTAAIANASA